MSIDTSFYNNVFLLMQVVPASFECTKHLRKGMFDKPNSSGFIHVSHYLLSVHNSKEFKKMVNWPIMNKADEKRYRAEIKNYLEILANENPDIEFPQILISRLFHATGTKFLNIMWKISVISLRAYLSRQNDTTLLQPPKAGINYNITKTFLININRRHNINIFKFHKKIKLISKNFEHYMQNTSDHLKTVQTDIFNTMETIEKWIPMAPVSPLILAELRNIENSDIINMWKTNIKDNIKYLQNIKSNLNKLKILSNTLDNLSTNLFVDCKIFHGKDLTNINTGIVPLCFGNNIQHINKGLYKNGCLILHTLLLIFNKTLKHMEYCLTVNIPIDLSNYESTIFEHCEKLKSMEESFQKLEFKVSNKLHDVQCHTSQEKSLNYTMETDFFNLMSEKILYTSPELNFSINVCKGDEKLYKRLCFSPLKGKYNHLFKRHPLNRQYKTVSPNQSPVNNQFNNSLENVMQTWNSPKRQLLTCNQKTPNKREMSPIYTRLFSPSSSKQNNFKGNNAASTPMRSQIVETPKRSKTQSMELESVNVNDTMKDIFDLSCKITKLVESLPTPSM
ncbi:uncharacterized protein LOC128875183 [Hylaeus volcanicus]|uniref:uncharacterized protein LOC128875183 n=1 Tax=Hylaeus volcanicus TaxID=313075 RepID=UPI0023B87908|nr:uncharacterized protein LOC128875183 [Hylaeus volcanicus]